jgi:hypothetical protein
MLRFVNVFLLFTDIEGSPKPFLCVSPTRQVAGPIPPHSTYIIYHFPAAPQSHLARRKLHAKRIDLEN